MSHAHDRGPGGRTPRLGSRHPSAPTSRRSSPLLSGLKQPSPMMHATISSTTPVVTANTVPGGQGGEHSGTANSGPSLLALPVTTSSTRPTTPSSSGHPTPRPARPRGEDRRAVDAHDAATEEEEDVESMEPLQLGVSTGDAVTTGVGGRKRRRNRQRKGGSSSAALSEAAEEGTSRTLTHTGKSAPPPVVVTPATEWSTFFSQIELTFQLSQDRVQRQTLFPRDVGHLLLWSVPSPVPLIESPRIFFVKNKSRLRDVVVIYVNGWSYDMMMCTGVGLPRESMSAPTAQGGHAAEVSASEGVGVAGKKRGREGTSTESIEEEAPPPQWDEALCAALLRPVRQELCWARESCGVQYAPLFIPSMKNTLEMDLFWRNDPPRQPRNSTSAAAHSGRGGQPAHASTNSGEDGAVDTSRTTPPSCESRGVSSLFKKAREIHSNASSPVAAQEPTHIAGAAPSPSTTTTTTTDAPAPAEAPMASATAVVEGEADTVGGTDAAVATELWSDRALLEQFALHLPRDQAAFEELGFTLHPPLPPSPSLPFPSSSLSSSTEAPVRGTGIGAREDAKEECKDGDAETTSRWDSFPPANVEDEESDSAASSGRPPKVFAFDCEMVLVDDQSSALARATLVNVHTSEVVMDWLVKPDRPVVNYLTRFSGVDEAALRDVQTTLKDCQEELKRHIDARSFVVGHSLENDFKACRMIPNCFVLDTAWLYPHPSGLPYKNALRFLSQRYLNKRIQQGCHDSSIDALTSAQLVQLKLQHGPSFGVREKVSVLGLIAAAATTRASGVGPSSSADSHAGEHPSNEEETQESSATRSTASPLAIRIQLFDDAVNLTQILPKDSKQSQGVIDAIPVRHDEDATRKVTRALQHRTALVKKRVERRGPTQEEKLRAAASAFAGEGGSSAHQSGSPSSRFGADAGSGDSTAADVPFSLVWVQLTPARVDVVRPSPSPSLSAEECAMYTQQQHDTIDQTNRRVLRIIDACPDETLVLVLAGDCRGEQGGNHFSTAQGVCFGMVKDHTARGPPPSFFSPRTERASPPQPSGMPTHGSKDEEEGCEEEVQGRTPPIERGKPTSEVSHVEVPPTSEKQHADFTPPACQPQ